MIEYDANASNLPLVIDLDGTLIHTDLLVESFFSLLRCDAYRAFISLFCNKAAIKSRIAARVTINWDAIPYNEKLLIFLHKEKARGRRIYLASAASHMYVRQIADKLALFDGIFASDEKIYINNAYIQLSGFTFLDVYRLRP